VALDERTQSLRTQVHDGLEEPVADAIVDLGERLAPERIAGRPAQDLGLRRLLERHDREERGGRELPGPLDHPERCRELLPGQRVQWPARSLGGSDAGDDREQAQNDGERRDTGQRAQPPCVVDRP
jgi:hypothetical protein